MIGKILRKALLVLSFVFCFLLGSMFLLGSAGYLFGIKKMLWFEVPDVGGYSMAILIALLGATIIGIVIFPLLPNKKIKR